MGKRRATTLLCLCALAFLSAGALQRSEGQTYTVNVTTGHQDIPATICSGTGCVYRTGQNLQESTVTFGNINKSTFGQYCYYDQLDGQVYGQPLVVTNVTMQADNQTHNAVVYVVTMNGSVYAFDGTPTAPSGAPGVCMNGQVAGPIAHRNLLSVVSPGSTAASCASLGAGGCKTIAPNVGILGTPVISANTGGSTTTGTLYLVLESEVTNGTTTTFSHTLFALDITSLTSTATVPIIVPAGAPPAGCYGTNFSQLHIQRPALLLGGDSYLYIAFSMMDGNQSPLPNGMLLAYNTVGLGGTSTPLCLAMSHGAQNADGAGIWGGGGGPVYAQDPNDSSKHYIFFNTANGVFDLNTGGIDAGDSFIQLSNAGAATPLSIVGSYTPGDQYWRSNKNSQHPGCSPEGDVDFGSGSPILIPDGEDSSWPYLAVSGDKEGGLWFMDWTNPGGYTGSSTCSSTINSDPNVQTFKISTSFPSGPLIHHSPAFWENCCGSAPTNYLFVGTSSQGQGTGELLQYQICGSGNPISSVSPCTQAGTYAYQVSGTPIAFPWGATPSISAASDSQSDAIVWVIWADGSVVPSSTGFKWHGEPFPVAQRGILYAFDAVSMKQLYSSNDCVMTGGSAVDQINPATKNSIPTVANGFAYVGTQGDLVPNTSCSDPTAACFNTGTFYIFGHFNSPRTVCQ
jgi:hypothetical protein